MPSRGVRAYAEVWLYRERAIRIHARYLRAMNEAVEIARLPLEEQAPRYRTWRERYGHVENVGDGFCLAHQTEIALLRGHASLRCAQAALAAERYRQKHGTWPQSLADLVPQYLPAVPLNPFEAKPLRYRTTDRGAIIYALCDYSTGKPGDPNRVPDATTPSNDVVFTLWNVDQRRQPALPVPKQAPPQNAFGL